MLDWQRCTADEIPEHQKKCFVTKSMSLYNNLIVRIHPVDIRTIFTLTHYCLNFISEWMTVGI